MSFLKKGKQTEKKFAEMFEDYKFSTKQEDIKEHWDIEIKSKVDVKGMKKIRRSDEFPNQNYHWIEIKNVNGEHGWSYGKADFFAFEIEKYWIVVSKEDLQELIKDMVVKEMVESPSLYKLYQRKGRKDIMTLVTSYDLCAVATTILKKK